MTAAVLCTTCVTGVYEIDVVVHSQILQWQDEWRKTLTLTTVFLCCLMDKTVLTTYNSLHFSVYHTVKK